MATGLRRRMTRGSDADASTNESGWVMSMRRTNASLDWRCDDGDVVDVFGDRVAELMNRHFPTGSSKHSEPWISPSTAPSFSIPLLSRSNWRLIREQWSFLRTMPLRLAGRHVLQGAIRFITWRDRPSVRDSTVFMAQCTLLFIIILAIVVSNLTIVSSQAVAWLLARMASLLIDWRILVQNPPLLLTWFLPLFGHVLIWWDNHVAARRKYAGREWSTTQFSWNPNTGDQETDNDDQLQGEGSWSSSSPQTTSANTSLWDLPPPSVHVLDRKLQLQPTFVMAWANALSQHNQWSRETAEHITAIHFCYMLLQQEKHELQRKEERKRQSRWIQECRKDRAATESIISMPDSSTVTVIPTLHHKVTGQEQYPLTPSEAIELRMQPHQYTIEEWSDGGKKKLHDLQSSPVQQNDDLSITSGSDGPDLPWIDVGAKIGMRFLNSAHVQRVMASQDTTERLLNLNIPKESSGPHHHMHVARPMHSMWSINSKHRDKPPQQAFDGTPLQLEARSSSYSVDEIDRSLVGIRELEDSAFEELLATRREHVSGGSLTNVLTMHTILPPGVKIAIPISHVPNSHYEVATVVSSKRIHVPCSEPQKTYPNSLSITAKLDRCYLRNGNFAELTFRVSDDCPMPKHSKAPIGSCVATTYGIGVLVGWRVEDECHVVRSLWHKHGAHAYLQSNHIHGTVPAAVGFEVETTRGSGIVTACTGGGCTFVEPKFLVGLSDEEVVIEVKYSDITSCPAAQFIPIIEHIREAATFQIQVDNYLSALRENELAKRNDDTHSFWKSWSDCLGILWDSFLKAVDEDREFDEGVNEFMSELIQFLEGLSTTAEKNHDADHTTRISEPETEESLPEEQEAGIWLLNDLLGGILQNGKADRDDKAEPQGGSCSGSKSYDTKYYDRLFSVIRVLRRTLSLARAASFDHTHFRLALAILNDFLLFLRTVIQIQQKNASVHSLEVWKRAWAEVVATFGPLQKRLQKIGIGIKNRIESQGRRAKIRLLKFVDTILSDERLLIAIEQGDWMRCLSRLEIALLKAKIIKQENLGVYHKTAGFLLKQMQAVLATGGDAATRNSEKLNILANVVQSLAAPKRSILKLLTRDDVLSLVERILVRTYHKESDATRMLSIHASNFRSLRHLRMLKDFSVAGRIWIPLLDAADEEFSWIVSRLPENSKEFMCPISSLFSLCVAQFHQIHAGDLSRDWLAFLLEDDSIRIIQELDVKLILALESFSRDICEMMIVLPYYASIDDDILNLMDEVDLEKFLKEVADALEDSEDISHFLQEKATIAIERFLNYLPKMSIPVEKRDLGGDMTGWVLTCRGENGGDLTLSDINIRRENLICQIMGGDTIFFPTFGSGNSNRTFASTSISAGGRVTRENVVEESILDEIREIILRAQREGCWKVGVGGIGQPPSDLYAASVLQGLPVSSVLNCGIELWRNLEIDDDELLEIAIKDVSYQIQVHKERESMQGMSHSPVVPHFTLATSSDSSSSLTLDNFRRRFNPRVDPSILFLEMKNLKLHLENFLFRIEKKENRTIFDPVFEGRGMVSLHNMSIKLRIECAKERTQTRSGCGSFSPVLYLRELEVHLEKVRLKVHDTGFGSDWLLNRAVHVFSDSITRVVEENLREQIHQQVKAAICSINSYFTMNPKIFLNILGISLDDLNEKSLVWV